MATATRPFLRARAAIAAPQAIGRPAPMIAAVGNSPTLGSTKMHGAADPARAADGAAADLADHAGRSDAEGQRMAVASISAGHDVIGIDRSRDADGIPLPGRSPDACCRERDLQRTTFESGSRRRESRSCVEAGRLRFLSASRRARGELEFEIVMQRSSTRARAPCLLRQERRPVLSHRRALGRYRASRTPL